MRLAQEIWEAVLGELQIQVSKPNYDTWLKDTTGISYQDDLFVVGVPNVFVAEWLNNRLHSVIKRTLAGTIGSNVDVQFLIQVPSQTDPRPAYAFQSDGGTSTKLKGPVKPSNLNPKYTFDTFITGKSNRLAYAAALEVAEEPWHVFNPLFIYGDTGIGKTHLLHAIGHSAQDCELQVLYTSAEQFTNDFVASLKNSKTEDFHHKFRDINVLLLDDIQFLSGKTQTQECFFHIFNGLHDNNCQIVITSDRPPKDIPAVGKKLKSRLGWGLIADIRTPDQETSLTILTAKAKRLKISIPPEVAHFLATQFRRNVREMEGALNRVATYAILNGTSLDVRLATQALADILAKDNQKETTSEPKLVIEAVANYYALTPEALIGKGRDKKTVLARHIAMYLIREQNHCRLAEIGRLLGGRDHTTILHGCQKIASSIDSDHQLKKAIEEVRHELISNKP